MNRKHAVMSTLSIYHINCRSLANQFLLLKEFVDRSRLGIFALTETWLNENVSSDPFNLDNFSFIRRDRVGRGGGVAMYLPTMLRFEIIETPFTAHIEQLWIKFSFNHKIYTIGVVYRKPGANYNEFF